MGLLSWIILGGFSGWIASMITGKNSSMGLIDNIAVGILGSFIGGFLVNLMTGKVFSIGFNFTSLVVSIFGAIILLVLINLLRGGRRR